MGTQAEQEALIAEMAAAGGEQAADTSAETANPPAEDTASEQPSEAQADAAEKEADKAPDPWDGLRKQHTPEEIEEALKIAADRKAMDRTSHQRYAQANEKERRAEEALAKAERALERNDSITNALTKMAAVSPELATQFLATLNQQGVVDQQYGGPAAPQRGGDPRVEALERQLAELKSGISGFAYSLNSGAAQAQVTQAVMAQPILKSLETIGEMDEVVERVMVRLHEMDRAEPGRVNPHNHRVFAALVTAEVKKEAEREQKRRDFRVKEYRAQKRADAEKVPPSSRGPAASVRSAPNQSGQPPPNLRGKALTNWHVQDMLRRSRPPTNGMAKDI